MQDKIKEKKKSLNRGETWWKIQQIYFWDILQYVEKQATLIDMKDRSHCMGVFKIVWQDCRAFQKNSNSGFNQSWN